VPRPGGTAEDDGAVLSPCIGADGKAFALLLDAGSCSWQEVARAELPYRTPYRFHGAWVWGDEA
jgi:carotenoid cleavage dioxygenase-like enzyme